MTVTTISWKTAERMIGHRVDRRRAYGREDQHVFYVISFVDSCSGCFEGGEYGGLAHNYPTDKKHGIRLGAGCFECGYTGKRRHSIWTWVDPDNISCSAA